MNAEVELEKMLDFLEEKWTATPVQRQNLLLLREIFEKVKPGKVSRELDEKDDEICDLVTEVESLKDDVFELRNKLDAEECRRQDLQAKVAAVKRLAEETETLIRETMDEWDVQPPTAKSAWSDAENFLISVRRGRKALDKIT